MESRGTGGRIPCYGPQCDLPISLLTHKGDFPYTTINLMQNHITSTPLDLGVRRGDSIDQRDFP
jgi:hypothetical protein